VFWRNGDVMVQVWKDKTCVNDKYDPLHNNCKQREERQEKKHGNKEALCCWPVTVKWSKKVVLYLLNCVLFNTFFV